MMKLRNSPTVRKTSSLLAAAIFILAIDTKVCIFAFSPQSIAVCRDCFPPMLPQMVIEQKSKASAIHYLDSNRALPSSRSDFERKEVFSESVQALQREGESAIQEGMQSVSFGHKAGKWIVFGFLPLKVLGFFDVQKPKTAPASKIKRGKREAVKEIEEATIFTRWLLQFVLLFAGTAVFPSFLGEPGVVLSQLQKILYVMDFALLLASWNRNWSKPTNVSTPEIQTNGFKSYDGSFPITAEQS